MSFLASRLRESITGSRIALRSIYIQPITAASSFHSSRTALSLKESDKNRPNLESHYEAEKQDQLKATREGKAKWRDGLASNSESDVKADRGDLDNDCPSFAEMERKTKDLPNRKGHVNKTQ